MELFDLKTSKRNTFGKNAARALRRQGFVPAVLYGPTRESQPLRVAPFDLDKIYKTSGTERVIFNLVVENGDTSNVTAVVKEIQTSPVTGEYLHIDFYEISLTEEIVVNVPVEVTGKSKGVERGGFLQVVRHELEISCLPADMPNKIEIDVSPLDIGETIHVGDIVVEDKVKLMADTGLTVATVVAPSVAEEEVPEEELEEPAEGRADEVESAEESANN